MRIMTITLNIQKLYASICLVKNIIYENLIVDAEES